jgi:hypothetical protein
LVSARAAALERWVSTQDEYDIFAVKLLSALTDFLDAPAGSLAWVQRDVAAEDAQPCALPEAAGLTHDGEYAARFRMKFPRVRAIPGQGVVFEVCIRRLNGIWRVRLEKNGPTVDVPAGPPPSFDSFCSAFHEAVMAFVGRDMDWVMRTGEDDSPQIGFHHSAS